MKHIILAAAFAAALSGAASAQMTTSSSDNPAMKDPTITATANAAKGRNSFTQTQAQSRIAKAGYTDIGKLMKNDNGVWQGKAMKNGKSVMVALDYKGDVTTY